jgi:hypothetical protein
VVLKGLDSAAIAPKLVQIGYVEPRFACLVYLDQNFCLLEVLAAFDFFELEHRTT